MDKLDEAQHEHMMGAHKNTLTKVKEALKSDNKRLTHGYTMTKGNVRIGSVLQRNKQDFVNLLKKIEDVENEKRFLIHDRKDIIKRDGKKEYEYYLRQYNLWLKELKTHKNEIYKLL